jgi:hypothetical protein
MQCFEKAIVIGNESLALLKPNLSKNVICKITIGNPAP